MSERWFGLAFQFLSNLNTRRRQVHFRITESLSGDLCPSCKSIWFGRKLYVILIARRRPSAQGTEMSSLLNNTNWLGTSITWTNCQASKSSAPKTKQRAPSTAAASIAKVVETMGSPESIWKVSSFVISYRGEGCRRCEAVGLWHAVSMSI